MRRFSGTGIVILARFLLAILIASSAIGLLPASAQTTPDYAGIVIRPGDGTVTYAYVPLDETVSGIDLLRRSGVSLLTVGFGGLGEGVCRIQETGCDVGPCRTRLCQTGDRESPYWRYFHQDANGQWVGAPLGGSATKVSPGEVDGWSWTPDDALLPEVTIEEIPALALATENREEVHIARYDANGKLVQNDGPVDLKSNQSYLIVLLVLAGVAVFALTLRLRPRRGQ